MSELRQISPDRWVDRTAGTHRAWQYDANEVRIAKASRRNLAINANRPNKHFVSQRENEAALKAAAAVRQTDQLERARSFLQRSMPVYAAHITGGPVDHYVVGQRTLTRAELIDLARARGFTG